MPTYRDLTRTSPEYLPGYWQECRALYKGGRTLLQDPETLARVFPKHGAEEDLVYRERMSRAVYINYAGTVIDYIVAALCAEPLTLTSEPAAPAFYAEFARAVDGRSLTLSGLLRQQILTALQTCRAWTLVDLPPRDDGAVIESERDEEDVGLLRAFALPIEPECVLDWDESSSGDLEWAIVCMRSQPRKTLADDRSMVTERFTYYTRESWERYEVTYKAGKPPKLSQEIKQADGGAHSFGKVPLVRLELPEGMWAMNVLHNLAREHLNKRSSTSWSQYRHLFPILSAHLAPEMGTSGEIPSEAAQDPGRATNQVYGIGRIMVFGKDDALKYTSPDTAIYESALKDLDGLRDEIYRVVHQMALAANNSAASLGRAADSKRQDQAAATVVLGTLGGLTREHAVEIHKLAAAGRRDPEAMWTAHGMEDFDTEALGDVINEEAVVDTLSIPSPTFQRIRKFATAKKIVRGSASPEQLETIREEIEKNVSDEQFAAPPPPRPGQVPGEEPDGDEEANPRSSNDQNGEETKK